MLYQIMTWLFLRFTTICLIKAVVNWISECLPPPHMSSFISSSYVLIKYDYYSKLLELTEECFTRSHVVQNVEQNKKQFPQSFKLSLSLLTCQYSTYEHGEKMNQWNYYSSNTYLHLKHITSNHQCRDIRMWYWWCLSVDCVMLLVNYLGERGGGIDCRQ